MTFPSLLEAMLLSVPFSVLSGVSFLIFLLFTDAPCLLALLLGILTGGVLCLMGLTVLLGLLRLFGWLIDFCWWQR